jgi:hypothetical protein
VIDKCDADGFNCLSRSQKVSTLPTSMLCNDSANIVYNDGRDLGSTKSKIVSGVFRRDDDDFVILENPSFPVLHRS